MRFWQSLQGKNFQDPTHPSLNPYEQRDKICTLAVWGIWKQYELLDHPLKNLLICHIWCSRSNVYLFKVGGEAWSRSWCCWITGLHQKRVCTCLGISCPQCVHHLDCFLLMHICISIVLWCTHWVSWHSMHTPEIFGVRIECLGTQCVRK